MSITAIRVQKRKHISASGFANGPVESKVVSRVPTLKELIYDIYDYQRKVIAETTPKRFICNTPTPIKQIERIYHLNQKAMAFDGMSHSEAVNYFMHAALAAGIRNDFCIPFIFANKITVKSPAFAKGYSYIFEKKNGMRFMTLCTQQEFNWLVQNRQILSNLSFMINEKYNCNLYMAYDEAERVKAATGTTTEHNRELFTRACDYYTDPSYMMSLTDFIRCQVPVLREYDDFSIETLINSDDDAIMAFDPNFAYELQQAKSIYNGRLKQWVGDFSHEPILGE